MTTVAALEPVGVAGRRFGAADAGVANGGAAQVLLRPEELEGLTGFPIAA